MRAAGKECDRQKKGHLQHCSPGHHLLPKALGWQHEETPERGQGLWARNTGAGLGTPPPPGNWTRRALHWLGSEDEDGSAPRLPGQACFANQTLVLQGVFSCPLCPNRDHLLCVSNRWLVNTWQALQPIFLISFPLLDVKLFSPRPLCGIPKNDELLLPSANRQLGFFL